MNDNSMAMRRRDEAEILPLDPSKRSTDTVDFQTALRSKIVGQEEGVHALVDLYQVFRAGLNSPGRPVGNLLFLGPTGSGKTRMVEAAAEILFGEARAVIKIDCAEFQHSHEIAKLIGSPPGYLGHRETHPLITQETLAANYRDDLKLSFLLFDEIEKASDALWQLLLGMLDKATLTLGDNRKVDLSQTVIFLTSNLGGGEIAELMQGGMGFIQPTDKPITGLDEQVERTARGHFVFRVTAAGRDFLLREGTDQRYGARHLKRAIERHVVYPLANLLATEQIHLGDLVCIDWDRDQDRLTFIREGENLAMPARRLEPAVPPRVAKAHSGKSVEAPASTTAAAPTPRGAP